MPSLVSKIPNALTILRLVFIPVFVVLMVNPTQVMINWAIVIFIIASLTDCFDGFIARRFGAVSDLGKLLDPVADKILVMAALVMLLAQRSDSLGNPWVPGWMVVLVLARETWVTGLRAVAASSGKIVAAGSAGKIKSILQMAAIVALLLHDQLCFELFQRRITFQMVGLNLLLVSLIASYWGAIEYTFSILGEEPEESEGDEA